MKKIKLVLGVLIVFGVTSVVAQVPSGHFSYSITNPLLWDISGIYTNHISTPGGDDTVIMEATQSARGSITGTRTDSVADGTEINATIKGKVSAKGAGLSAKLSMKGTVSAFGYTGKATGKGIGTLHPDALTVEIAGAMKGCVKTPHGTGCETFTGDTTAPLPAGMNGEWTLDTDITATGTSLAGTGTITLSNGRLLTYQLTGNYSTTTEEAKLKLSGTGAAVGTSLSLETHGPNMDVTALKGKVLGQKPVFP